MEIAETTFKSSPVTHNNNNITATSLRGKINT